MTTATYRQRNPLGQCNSGAAHAECTCDSDAAI